MSLEDLSSEVKAEYGEIGDTREIAFDRQTKNELALLRTVLGTEDVDELIRRGVHLLFQSTVDTGGLDFQLRRSYDLTYDEYLSGMTYEEMRGAGSYEPITDDDRRYQF